MSSSSRMKYVWVSEELLCGSWRSGRARRRCRSTCRGPRRRSGWVLRWWVNYQPCRRWWWSTGWHNAYIRFYTLCSRWNCTSWACGWWPADSPSLLHKSTSLRNLCFSCWDKLVEYHFVNLDLPCRLIRKKQWIIFKNYDLIIKITPTFQTFSISTPHFSLPFTCFPSFAHFQIPLSRIIF